ncbi:MAG: virulence RhuM family protein [Lentimicrobiaceae bacterium]|nr:virulence RhuM family protein [Lentimicrobiaceae bacterium]MCL2131991.1 virulence RhuM family protein [Lentimicrobiaceae bacterium]
MENEIIPHLPSDKGEIVLYQPDNSLALEVMLEDETVWLTQAQMAELFLTTIPNINMHLKNIFEECELQEIATIKDFLIVRQEGNRYVQRNISFYNLDAIISVGYRIKSRNATLFRQWATKTLKDYLFKGYAVNQRFERLERRVSKTENQINFIVRGNIKPKEGVFYDGQIFDAYAFVADLIKSAKKTIVLIDNYIDESVLLLLSKRAKGVSAIVYTSQISEQLRFDLQKHNQQYPAVKIKKFTKSHDRFLIIDGVVHFFGASFKDLGKKLFAFAKMEMKPEKILE